MTTPRRYALLPVLTSLILTGCAMPGTFPSLARRPQEDAPGRIAGTLPAPQSTAPAVPAPPAGPNPGAAETIAALGARAEAAHRRFGAQRDADVAAIRAGRQAAQGSEAWARGNVALADLTAEHDATVAALAELDGLYAAARIDGGDGGAIAAVRDQVTAWVADEDAVLAELVGP